jgi:competence protein ComEC
MRHCLVYGSAKGDPAMASALVQALVQVLAWLGTWPIGLWTAAAAPAWGVASGLLGGALLIMPLPWRLRLLGLPLLLPLLAPPIEHPAAGEFEVVAVDIGQGSAVLVRTRQHLLLYDTGPKYSSDADAAQRVLLPLLRARGESRIDVLMLSHRDSDHVGGAASLLAQGDVRSMHSSLSPAHPLRGAGLPHQRCLAGQSWHWDGVDFQVLHHGSRSSSTLAFIEAVAPGTALVQAAYRSRFGHPAPEVMARHQALGVELLRSDACGAWSWQMLGSTRCERESAVRYWHHRANAEPDAVR